MEIVGQVDEEGAIFHSKRMYISYNYRASAFPSKGKYSFPPTNPRTPFGRSLLCGLMASIEFTQLRKPRSNAKEETQEFLLPTPYPTMIHCISTVIRRFFLRSLEKLHTKRVFRTHSGSTAWR